MAKCTCTYDWFFSAHANHRGQVATILCVYIMLCMCVWEHMLHPPERYIFIYMGRKKETQLTSYCLDVTWGTAVYFTILGRSGRATWGVPTTFVLLIYLNVHFQQVIITTNLNKHLRIGFGSVWIVAV